MSVIRLTLPLDRDAVGALRAGDAVTLSGVLYTARDAAHRRMIACIDQHLPLPIAIAGETLYYAGPAPTPPGYASGAAGPTTSYRMDAYTPQLLERGLIGMIGKGRRNRAVIDAMVAHGAVYFAAVGGAAALIARAITETRVVAYPDLGAEAIHRLVVRDFPAIVAIDTLGNDVYALGPARWREAGDAGEIRQGR